MYSSIIQAFRFKQEKTNEKFKQVFMLRSWENSFRKMYAVMLPGIVGWPIRILLNSYLSEMFSTEMVFLLVYNALVQHFNVILICVHFWTFRNYRVKKSGPYLKVFRKTKNTSAVESGRQRTMLLTSFVGVCFVIHPRCNKVALSTYDVLRVIT